MMLAIQKSSPNVNITNGLVTGGFQKKPFQYEHPVVKTKIQIWLFKLDFEKPL